jgi:hypothetical protein
MRMSKPEVQNPVLGLPSTKRLASLPVEVRTLLADIVWEIALDARERAQASWKRRKAPMAFYWKVVSVYAGHLSRAIRRLGRSSDAI